MERIKVTHERIDLELLADAYAYVCDMRSANDDCLLLLSVAGPERAIEAMKGALLSNNTKARLLIGYKKIKPISEGYRIYKTLLDAETRTWHAVVIAKTIGFMPVWDEVSLWNELRHERFTTPVLKKWLPWIKEQIEAKAQIRLSQHNCHCALLHQDMTTHNLDKFIQMGLKERKITIG